MYGLIGEIRLFVTVMMSWEMVNVYCVHRAHLLQLIPRLLGFTTGGTL